MTKPSCIAGDLLPSGEGDGRGAGAALRLREGAAAPVRRLLQEVGELPLLLGQHAVGRPRRRSVSLDFCQHEREPTID